MPKIQHYREKCIGCNSCIEIDPSNWEMSEKDGKSILKDSKEKKGVYVKEISDAELEDAKRAERDCPARIIKVHK